MDLSWEDLGGFQEAYGALAAFLFRDGQPQKVPLIEEFFQELGYRRKAPDAGERRADFCLENVMTGTHIFADVRIVHQDMTASATVKDPYADLEAVYKQKMAHYKEAFELETAGVQPLVFDIFGNYAKGTFEFLASLVRQITKNDDVKFQKLWIELRNRIAALVEYYRYKNGDGARRHYEHDPNLARQNQSEPRDAPAEGEEQSSDAANGTAGTGGARRGHGHTGGAEESEDSTRGVG